MHRSTIAQDCHTYIITAAIGLTATWCHVQHTQQQQQPHHAPTHTHTHAALACPLACTTSCCSVCSMFTLYISSRTTHLYDNIHERISCSYYIIIHEHSYFQTAFSSRSRGRIARGMRSVLLSDETAETPKDCSTGNRRVIYPHG